MERKTVWITGADRGVGFSLCEKFLEGGWHVFAGQFMPEWPALDALREKYHIPVYVHEKEQHLLGDPKENLSGLWSKPYTMQADKTVKEGDVLHLADFEIHVLATPGHTAGGVCYYIPAEKALFSGDTLFCESYGRYDFPTSSGRELIASVKRLLKDLPGDVTVYPGHNDETTIEHEKRYNPLA